MKIKDTFEWSLSIKSLCVVLCPQLSHELEQRWFRCEARVRVRRIRPDWEKGGTPALPDVSHIVRSHRFKWGLWEEPAAPIILQNWDQKSQFRRGKCVSVCVHICSAHPVKITIWFNLSFLFCCKPAILRMMKRSPAATWTCRISRLRTPPRGSRCSLAAARTVKTTRWMPSWQRWRWGDSYSLTKSRICLQGPDPNIFFSRIKQPKIWGNWRRRRKNQPSKIQCLLLFYCVGF